MTSQRREPRIPDPDLDLVGNLVLVPDPSLGDPENLACRAMPRHLRLYVAGWMLSDGTAAGDKRALREAYQLYELSGRNLLDQPRMLTTADIVAEVLQLLGSTSAEAHPHPVRPPVCERAREGAGGPS
jgi:hypothetical protein